MKFFDLDVRVALASSGQMP
ncbi:FDLD family class I lanthipeptide [Nonomuraea sp. NPDC050451]